MRRYSLAHLTVLKASPPRLIELAGRAGYDFVGLRLRDVLPGDGWPLVPGSELMLQTKQALVDHRIQVLDVELAKLTPDFSIEALRPMAEAAADLGASHILTQGHDDDRVRMVENLQALADLASEYRLTVDVEFLTWTSMRGVAEVRELLVRSGRNNVGVVVDSLHFCRSRCTLAELEAVPANQLHYIQLSDASPHTPSTREALIHTAREDRLLPGEGGLDLVSIIQRLPEATVIGLEIPNTRLANQISDEERVSRALCKAKAVVAQADASAPIV